MFPSPLASRELLALSVTMVLPSSCLSFSGQIKTSPACLFKGSTLMVGILISFSVHHFPTSGFHILLSWFIIHYDYYFTPCATQGHITCICFFNRKWRWRDSYAEASRRETWHAVWLKKDRIVLNYFTTGGARHKTGSNGGHLFKVSKKSWGKRYFLMFLV